jgi:lysophospholipase L1-like esterase
MPVLPLLAFLLATVQAQPDPARWEEAIRKFEEADRESFPRPGGIVFVGSSSIAGWRTLASDFPHHRAINRGFGGSHLSDVVYFADRIVTRYRPRMVVLFAGTNDLAAGKSPETVFADFQAFVGKVRAKSPKARIAFISISPTPSRWANNANVVRANSLIREYVYAGQNLAFIDVYSPMIGPDGGPRPELFVGDRLHLNAQGYALWKKIVEPYLPWR